MRNHPVIVQKYGGVCLETPAKIRAVARSLAHLHACGHRVVAIVSAMGTTTDQLIEMTGLATAIGPASRRGSSVGATLTLLVAASFLLPALRFRALRHFPARIVDHSEP